MCFLIFCLLTSFLLLFSLRFGLSGLSASHVSRHSSKHLPERRDVRPQETRCSTPREAKRAREERARESERVKEGDVWKFRYKRTLIGKQSRSGFVSHRNPHFVQLAFQQCQAWRRRVLAVVAKRVTSEQLAMLLVDCKGILHGSIRRAP